MMSRTEKQDITAHPNLRLAGRKKFSFDNVMQEIFKSFLCFATIFMFENKETAYVVKQNLANINCIASKIWIHIAYNKYKIRQNWMDFPHTS